MTQKMAEYLLKGAANPAETDRSIWSAMPEEEFDDVEKVLSRQKAIEDRKRGRINDLLRLKAHVIKLRRLQLG